jgi:hypothetical protein
LYPFCPVTFGSGNRFSAANPGFHNRDAGIFPTTPPSAKQPLMLVELQG